MGNKRRPGTTVLDILPFVCLAALLSCLGYGVSVYGWLNLIDEIWSAFVVGSVWLTAAWVGLRLLYSSETRAQLTMKARYSRVRAAVAALPTVMGICGAVCGALVASFNEVGSKLEQEEIGQLCVCSIPVVLLFRLVTALLPDHLQSGNHSPRRGRQNSRKME